MTETLQEMSIRRLKNLRNEAMTNLLLGADNNEAIKSMDAELKRGGIVSNCDDCYWDISEKECHMQGKHKITDGTCHTYRKSDNRGAIQREETGKTINR